MEIRRDIYLNKLIRKKGNGLIKIVTGIRRCGKSYLLFRLFHNHLSESGVDNAHIIEIALDDRMNKSLRDPDNMLAYIHKRINDDKQYYILLDEVQLLNEFEDVLNSLLHIRNADVYVTGSNSKFLSYDIITEFRGRGDEIRVYPLSFREYMSAYNGTRDEAWDDYFNYGGLPLILSMPTDEDKANYLSGLFKKVYISDIVDRHKVRNKDELDELIRTLNDMLDRVDTAFQAEKSFISNASHELNNPLTAIQGECEISLLKERSAAEYIESLQRISTESKRIILLIKHLLFLSRQDKELLQNAREQIDLVVLLRDLCLQYPQVAFSTELAEGQAHITANYHLLRVALQNIIDNARKYSKEQVEICVGMHDGNWVIEVEDYGIGIPEDEIKHIFHSFYRASNTREYAGQGIGLSLSMKILAVYGGKITINSQVNKYTRVTVTFARV